MQQTKKKRCQYVILTTEARVLTTLRTRKGLSQRQLGQRLGKSGSWVAQIESGRADPPDGESLIPYLTAVGPITVKSFREYVRTFKEKTTDKARLMEAVERLNEEQSAKALRFFDAILAGVIG